MSCMDALLRRAVAPAQAGSFWGPEHPSVVRVALEVSVVAEAGRKAMGIATATNKAPGHRANAKGIRVRDPERQLFLARDGEGNCWFYPRRLRGISRRIHR